MDGTPRERVQGLVVDCFAGGGGASTGIAWALGRDPDIAINHSAAAIAMHTANHPGSRHFLCDVWEVDPVEACGGQPVALMWLSPDCTHFSKAGGRAPRSRKRRALATLAILWARKVRPAVIVLENVEEFLTWGPLDESGHPIKAEAGRSFRKWLRQLRAAGYKVEHRLLVAADFGAPTTRRRLFLIARCDGQPIVWPKPTHAKGGKGGLLPWRAAAEVIDWSLACPSIFDRKRPLAEKTLRRIAAGIRRYVLDAAKPFVVPMTHGGQPGRVHDVDDPLRTVTAANRGELGLCTPVVVPVTHTADSDRRAHTGAAPLPTITTAKGGELALVAPSLTKFYGTSTGSDLCEPSPTITGGGQHLGLVVPTLLVNTTGHPGRAADEPLATVTTGGHHALVTPTLIRTDMHLSNAQCAFDVSADPLRTVTSSGGFAVVAPSLVRVAHGDVDRHGHRRGRGHLDVSEPMPTVTTSHDAAVIAASLVKYHGGARCETRGQGPDEPLRTVDTENRFALLGASLVPLNSEDGHAQPRARSLEEPAPTVVASSANHCLVSALVVPAHVHGGGGNDARAVEEPLRTVTCAQRGEFALVGATLVAGYGERAGQPPRAADATAPLGAVVTDAKHALVAASLTQFNGRSVGSDAREPAPTPTGHAHTGVNAVWLAKHFGGVVGQQADLPLGTVTAVDHHSVVAARLEPATADRRAQVRAFLIAYYGSDGAVETQQQSLFSPLHTVPTRDRFGLVTVNGVDYEIADIGLRMLAPRELFGAQGFPNDYELRPSLDGKPLTKTEQIECAGNSVCPPLAEAIVRANVSGAHGARRASA